MTKNKHIKKELINWILWLLLIIGWNFLYPDATPLMDVIVSAFLSILFILINKYK